MSKMLVSCCWVFQSFSAVTPLQPAFFVVLHLFVAIAYSLF